MLRVHRSLPGGPLGVPRRGDVAVWVVALDALAPAEFASELAPDETERARRFHFEPDRRRFAGGRLALRRILAAYLAVAPRAIELRTWPHDKPALAASHGSALRFSLSHSGEVALVAVAAGIEVGVDVELRRPLPDLESLVARYFSPPERAAIEAVPAGRRLEAFFDYWTAKEAYLKAGGDGLARRLDAFDIVLDEAAAPRLVEVRDRPGDEHRWTLGRLAVDPAYAAAVAFERWDRAG
jgi:4'-phosphopantetheinyl transferase